jgi:radical SAM superfamily enzyme YgiQ (UPF0313 family)
MEFFAGKKGNVMNIALIQTPVWGVYGPSNALAQLSACMKNKSHNTKVFDLNIFLYNKRPKEYINSWAIERSSFWCSGENVDKFYSDNKPDIKGYIQKVISFQPDFACFSVNVSSWYSTLYTAKLIKEINPKIKTIIGGPSFLVQFDPGNYLKNECIDFIVFGEAEEALPELIKKSAEGASLAGCKGICYKENGNIITTGFREPLKNLDTLPFLDFSDTPFTDYDPPGHLGKHISIMTSRGCVQTCVFCGPKAYWSGYRSMSGKRIYEEIAYHLKNHPEIDRIEFLDLLLNGNMKTLNEFCALMAENKLEKELTWHANLIIRKEMDKKICEKMKKAGCDHVSIGIESGSQKVLDIMRKKYKVQDADFALKNLHEAGISVTCNFMFGFPGESDEDFKETLEFVERNKNYIDMAYPSRTFCTIEPYSYMQKHIDEFGVIVNPNHGQYWVSKDKNNTFLTRMQRCEEFSKFAVSIGVNIGLGLQSSLELDHWYNLGAYYEAEGNALEALKSYKKYLEFDTHNSAIKDKINELEKNINLKR